MKKKQINNRYEILRSLGEGGMGQVSLVADLQEEGREVALKSFRPVSTGGDELDLFKHEFLLLSSLHHPNVYRPEDAFASPTHVRLATFTPLARSRAVSAGVALVDSACDAALCSRT